MLARGILRTHRLFLAQRSHQRLRSSIPFAFDESADVLLERIDRDIGYQNELTIGGHIRSVDVNNGIVTCSGLSNAKIGDLVYLNENNNNENIGIVLTLEEYSVRLGILNGNPRTGNLVTMKEKQLINKEEEETEERHKINITKLLEDISNTHIDSLGCSNMKIIGKENNEETVNESILYMLSKATCHWKHWSRKPINQHISAYTRMTNHTDNDDNIDNKNTDIQGTIFSGVPALDLLCPIRRGGSIVISGPQKQCTQLATQISNNFLENDDKQNRNKLKKKKRVIYVNLGHNKTVLTQLANELKINENDETNETKQLTLISAPKSSSSSSLFSRTISPYLALELGEKAAMLKGEDVLVIIDEVGGLAHDVMNAQDALLQSSQKSHTKLNQTIRSKVALSTSSRTISASLLDRATIMTNSSHSSSSSSISNHHQDEQGITNGSTTTTSSSGSGGGGGSLSVIALMSVNPDYGALTASPVATSMSSEPSIDTTYDIIKEAFNGYSDSNLTLSYHDIFKRIRSRSQVSKPQGLSLDWDMVNDMNKLPPLFQSRLLKQSFLAIGTNNNDNDNDDKRLSSLSSSSESTKQSLCLGMLGISLRRQLKEASLVEFSAETAKELGILIEDENEISYRLIESTKQVKQLISESSATSSLSTANSTVSPFIPASTSSSISLYQKKIRDKLKLSTQNTTIQNNNNNKGGEGEGSKETENIIKELNEQNNENIVNTVDEIFNSNPTGSNPTTSLEALDQNNDYEAGLSISLCSLALLLKPEMLNMKHLIPKSSSSSSLLTPLDEISDSSSIEPLDSFDWENVAIILRTDKELLNQVEESLMESFNQISTNPDYASLLATEILKKVLSHQK